jgi:hypothetical protein
VHETFVGESRRFFDRYNITLEGHCGLANWSYIVRDRLLTGMGPVTGVSPSTDIDTGEALPAALPAARVWMVSDYKFNNFDYPRLMQRARQLDASTSTAVQSLLRRAESTSVHAPVQTPVQTPFFEGVVGAPGNVDWSMLELKHYCVVSDYTRRVIDYVLRRNPKIKLLFWCLYMRTKTKPRHSYPRDMAYDAVRRRYAAHVIDIERYVTPDEFRDHCVIDSGGHPNERGYELLAQMIHDAFSYEEGCVIDDHLTTGTT